MPERTVREVVRTRVTVRLAVALLGWLCSMCAMAADTDKALGDGEGWLVVIVDNDAFISSIRLDGPGLRGDDIVKNLTQGRNVRVVRAKAGIYRWSMLQRGDGYLKIGRDAQFAFTVTAGKVNYPGDFVVEAGGLRMVRYYRSNRGLQAMMALDQTYKGLRDKYPWHNDLPSPDPFIEFATPRLTSEQSSALLSSSETDARKWRERSVDDAFVGVFNELYAEPRAMWPSISPDGALLAFKERRDDLEVAVVVDLASGDTLDVSGVPGTIDQLSWASDRALYVGAAVDTAKVIARAKGKRVTIPLNLGHGLELVRFGFGPLDAKNLTRLWLPGLVWLANPLPDDATRGLVVRGDSKGELHVYALDENARRFDIANFRGAQRLDKGIDKAVDFFADQRGVLRAALVAGEEGARSLAVRADDGKWTIHPALPQNIAFTPVLLTPDGRELVVLTDHARDQIELATVSLADGAIGRTLLAEPGADFVDAVLRRRDRRVIGAQFYRNGSLQTRLLVGEDDGQLRAIEKSFPDANLYLVDDSRDGKRLVVMVYSESERGTFYLYDRDKRQLEKLVDVFDPLKKARLAVSKSFTVTARDGLAIDAFLTLPAGLQGAAPLVVMPHGGPISVSDRREFSAQVQMLANSGFAVLRVNYRGSGGAGRAFARAGEGQWGRDIENDVDLALDHALAHFPLERARVALWGASYGGYSTLMGLIRRPERYRCGVAVAAVTDLPLLFSSSDWIRMPESVARMQRIVGDPQTAMPQLREYSPVYQYERLRQPVLLIHGTDDTRVVFEHAWRLRALLAAAGRAPAWLPLPGANHNLSRTQDRLAMHAASDAFLRECLGPAAAAGSAAAPSPP